ncbi:MAG: alpha/beta hydrolase [Actinomycetota bacterium]|nr:alpha/beta hydrolase [Actinomycetota bacterium]
MTYAVAGPADGRPVLLICGGGGAMWSWGRLHPAFAAERPDLLMPRGEALADRRVATFDQAGVGASVAVPAVTSAEAYARDALAVGRRALGERFAVVGISLGGAAALQLALAEPGHVSALVLVATFAGLSSFADHDLPDPPPPPDPPPGAPAADERLRSEAIEVAASFGPTFPAIEPALFWEVVRRSAATPTAPGLADSQIAQFVSHDVTDRLGELSVPTVVVGGELDRTMPLGNTRLLAERIPGAALDVVAGAGHALHLEAPERIGAALTSAIGRAGPAPSPPG